jgi:hypothetical protein
VDANYPRGPPPPPPSPRPPRLGPPPHPPPPTTVSSWTVFLWARESLGVLQGWVADFFWGAGSGVGMWIRNLVGVGLLCVVVLGLTGVVWGQLSELRRFSLRVQNQTDAAVLLRVVDAGCVDAPDDINLAANRSTQLWLVGNKKRHCPGGAGLPTMRLQRVGPVALGGGEQLAITYRHRHGWVLVAADRGAPKCMGVSRDRESVLVFACRSSAAH